MKKFIILLLIISLTLFLSYAYNTKPDDKTCKEMVVRAVWGKIMPDKSRSPRFYGQFMDLYAKDITVDNWLFFKKIDYKLEPDKNIISIAAFNRLYFLKN